MSYIETPEDIAQQLEQARKELRAFEDNVRSKVLVSRLATAHPWHPALLARVVFGLFAILAVGGALAVVAIAFTAEESIEVLAKLEGAIGLPLPVALGICAACMFVAWLMATLAAVSVGRECEMMPDEALEHQRLTEQAARLARQKAVLERIRGTPMGARPRITTPVPALRQPTPLQADRQEAGEPEPDYPSSPTYGMPATPGASLRQPGTPLPGPKATAGGSLLSRTRGGSQGFMGAQTRGGTPLGVPPRSGTPIGVSRPTKPTVGRATPSLMKQRLGSAAGDMSYGAPSEDAEDYSDDPTVEPAYLDTESDSYDSSNYVIGVSTPPSIPPESGFSPAGTPAPMPRWGPIDDPWLEDALEKAEILAAAFPVQAHLEFNVDEGLPFTLVLKRATPAMAVRAMVSYVEFLASISTPPMGRVILRSVPHLDRSFHRNVMAALEPYFPDTAEVIRQRQSVDIKFLEPDPGWKRYPVLPVVNV